jgi:hypothetical protein
MKRTVVAALITTCALAIGGVALAKTLQYRATAVGEFEVPPRPTSAEADLKLKLDDKRDVARYDLKITEPIENVQQAHLHMAPEGVNGPIVAWLYPEDVEQVILIPGETDGRLARGTISEADLRGPLAGDWEGFVEALQNGDVYVNVHTVQFPGGEVRDQVEPHPRHKR